MTKALLASAALSALCVASAFAQGSRVVNEGTPPPDCAAPVAFDRNAELPGYAVERNGRRVCLPFMPANQLAPPAFTGRDFYVEHFMDAAIKARWAECRKDSACAERVLAGAKPFISAEKRDTGAVDAAGRIDPEGVVDLKAVRRPAFFGRTPYAEPIAASEEQAYTVEFTVPRDNYERLHLKKDGPIKLRGWFLQGAGVDDGAGRRVRALVVMNNGGGQEITAIDDPRSEGATRDAVGKWVAGRFPDALTEESGGRHWRGFMRALHAAGLDVLVTDRRGNGLSGGASGYNTAEQANDIFRELEHLDTGEGLRALLPSGEVLSGKAAADAVLSGARPREMPVVVGGYSRGSYATAFFMHKNTVEDCDLDLPNGACRPPRGWSNVRGAILYGPNAGGLGWRMAGHDLIEAALRSEFNTTYYPDGRVLAGIARWPALQVVRGTWDYVEGLEGSFDAFRRASGLKDIFVFLGPHVLNTQDPEAMRLAGARMAAFATAAALGRPRVEGAAAPRDLKELVSASPDRWETTTAPKE